MNHPRGAPTAPIARKRKERGDLFIHPNGPNPSNGNGKPRSAKTGPPLPSPSHPNTTSLKQKPSEPATSNRLVAGYLAHEFLTQGTLLGQKIAADPVEAKKSPGGPSAAPEKKGYGEVARILKTEGAHIQGVVNPTQLARWIQM